MDKANHRFAFQKVNFKWLLIGLAINFFWFHFNDRRRIS